MAPATRRHLFVCSNGRPSGRPACGPRGGDALIQAVQRALIARAAPGAPGAPGGDPGRAPLVTPCGCLGPCFDGPNAVVYGDAEAVWLAGLAPGDADALVDHLLDGRLAGGLADKRVAAPGAEAPDGEPG